MKIKRVLASFLALATVASAAVAMVSAAATGSLKVSVEDTTAVAGGEFTLDVNLTNVPNGGLIACDFAVSFDPSLVTITGVEEGEIGKTGAAEAELALDGGLSSSMLDDGDYSCFDFYLTDNQVRALWATGVDDSSLWIKDDGVFMTITGTVKENVEAGTEIKLDIVPTERDTYPGSGTENTDIIFGYLDSAGDPAFYDYELKSGVITVEGEVETTVTTEVTTPETDVTTPETDVTTPETDVTTPETDVTTPETDVTTPETDVTTPAETVDPNFVPMYGDVDLDGEVRLNDIITFNKFFVGAIEFSAEQRVNADAYYDGKLNMQDNLHIAGYLVFKVSQLGPTE